MKKNALIVTTVKAVKNHLIGRLANMKKIQYTITFLGEVEVPDNTPDEDIESEIARDWYEFGFDIEHAADVEWEEVR